MRAKIFIAALLIFQGAPVASRATPVQRLDTPLALERASGGCGSFAYRDPAGMCAPYSRRSGAYAYKGGGHDRDAWERPEWQGGDGGYLSGGAGWRGGGYYGPQ